MLAGLDGAITALEAGEIEAARDRLLALAAAVRAADHAGAEQWRLGGMKRQGTDRQISTEAAPLLDLVRDVRDELRYLRQGARGSGESCDRRAKVDGRFPIGVSNPHPKGTKPRLYSLHSIHGSGINHLDILGCKSTTFAAKLASARPKLTVGNLRGKRYDDIEVDLRTMQLTRFTIVPQPVFHFGPAPSAQ